MRNFRVAFVQGRPRFGATAENLERGLAMAAGVAADLVVLPELWSTGYVFTSGAELAALAEDAATGATARAVKAAAKREKRHYVVGFAERAGSRFYNSALLVGPGGVKTVYRKLHLFERERFFFTPGDRPLSVHRVGPARLGLLICFDWRFPEATRALALMGADVIAHPSNLVYTMAQEAMRWRSFENRVYVVTCNRTGTESRTTPKGERWSVPFTGRSQVVDPMGEVLVAAGKREEGAWAAECDLARARDKAMSPLTDLWKSRRPEFYGRVAKR